VTGVADTSDNGPSGHDIAGGASVGFIAQFASYAAGLGASILIARALGPTGRGTYYIPVATALACAGLIHLGLELANTYLLAERRETLERLMANASLTALLVGPLSFVLMTLFFVGTRDSIFRGVSAFDFAIAAITVPMQVHVIWMANLFALAGRVVQTQLIVAGAAIAQALAIAALYVAGALSVTSVLVVYAANFALAWVGHLYLARGFAPARPRLYPSLIREALRFGLKVHVGFIFWFLLLRSDVFLVKLELGAKQVGVYSLAVVYAELVVLLTSPLVVAALPAQSRSAPEDAGVVTFKVVRFNVALGFLLSIALAATLWLIFPTLYGAGFTGAYAAFACLIPGVVAMAGFRPLYNWLLRQSRPWLMSALSFAAFAVNVALNLVLLPIVGIIGSSIASSVAYVILTGVFLQWARSVAGITVRDALAYRREDLESLRASWARLVRRWSGPWLQRRSA
jgi:O-antigen/teichoic acid export membrane protein